MRKPVNIAASVRARLLNLSRERSQPFQLLLTRYVLERLLYRLSRTEHRDRFVLKGAHAADDLASGSISADAGSRSLGLW